MYRDFSTSSKQKLISLVSEVENEKINDFTDWIGDRWYDFESWIGKLNIKNYVNNVNSYHKKVIDKNNATKSSIEKIFSNVAAIDTQYKSVFSSTKILLQQWLTYIDTMEQIVNPSNGKFKTDFINSAFIGTLNAINSTQLYEEKVSSPITVQDVTKKTFKAEKSILDILSSFEKQFEKKNKSDKKNRSNDTALVSSSISYISSLYSFATLDRSNTHEVASGTLNFVKSSGSAWTGLYKYYDKSLSPLQASRLGKKFQGPASMVSLVGSICGFSAETINTYDVLTDEDSETYQKVNQVLKNTNSGLDIARAGANMKLGKKVLTRDVTAKYQWGTAAKNATKLDNTVAFLNVAGVAIDSISGGTEAYSEVTADGTLDMGDMGEIGIKGSVKGLTSIVGKATFGLTDVAGFPEKADEISDAIIDFVDTKGVDYVTSHKFSSDYIKNTQFMKDYADDESNNIFARIGVSAVAGLGMIGAITVDGVSDCASWIGNKISSGWTSIKNIF